ncbi:MAG: tol-pal system protein [Proteobacteria bacterium SG_bin9]|nr:MAG: tol-pal system protein [Proteobacteria bacterium SG_bin9]
MPVLKGVDAQDALSDAAARQLHQVIMSFRLPTLLAPLLMAAAVSTVAVPAQAQLFGRDGLFSRDRDNPPPTNNRDVDDDPQRIERLENMVRQLTGQNEQLQFRIRQLEDQLRAAQGGAPAAAPPQAPVAQLPPVQPPQQQTYQQPAQPNYQQPTYQQPQQQAATQPAQGQSVQIDQPPAGPRRPGRGDAFDPSQNPNAPGVPKALGGGQMTIPADSSVGAPGGRNAGEPLDLANTAPRGQGVPPPQQQILPGPQAGLNTAPPTQTPRDEYDLGIGYMQRKDYALAEETMRNFMQKYPSDRLVADAQYWLGESQYQRQQYRDAAESFLAVTSKYDKSAKAPDSLLRLGQSLAALKQKEAACAALGEVNRKYPKASNGVKQGVEREQKRVGC